MESGSLPTRSAQRKLGSPFSFWRSLSPRSAPRKLGSLSNRTPQDHAENSRSPTWDYEKCKTEMIKKPQIRRIFDIMELDMLLLNLINLTTGKLKTESNQNQLKQLVELIKMNVKLLIHGSDLLRSINRLNLKELDDLLAASDTSDQASTQHDDAVKKIKEIYDLLENAKANVGQFDKFDQNLIEDIRKLIQQYHEKFQAEHQLAPSGSNRDPNMLNNDVAEHIVNFLPVELRSASAKSNLNLVEGNLEKMILILQEQKSCESNSNQIKLKNKLIEVTRNLKSTGDCRLPNLHDDSKHAARIIQLAEHYIVKMDSFKDICNQVAAMYKHSHKKNIQKSEIGYTWCRSFHKDIFNGNCEGVEKFLKEHPLALTAKITVDGNTALHIAVKARKLKIVRMLLAKLEEEKKLRGTLEKQNKEGKTALYIAASGGFPTIAEELVKANNDTLLIKCENATIPSLPLFVAAKYDNKEVVRYLYKEMKKYKKEKEKSGDHQKLEFFPKENENVQKAGVWDRQWATFLANLIHNDEYDMALLVNGDYPSLALLRCTNVETPLLALAQRPSLGANKIVGDKASKFQLIPFTGGNKVDHNSTSKASKLLKQIISKIDLQSQESVLSDALFKAAEVGSVEFVTTIINSLPPVVSWLNDEYRNIFHVAIIHRQEEVFNLIYGLGPVMNDLAGSADKFNNWMLHLTGTLAPPYRLNQVPSAALQLQRELKWFKFLTLERYLQSKIKNNGYPRVIAFTQAVKAIVPNISTNVENLDKKTPYELFVSEHENLMKDGEKWIKDTASSCSIVAALITTVVFAAAFTIPGGNNQNSGNPIFLTDMCFLIFVISDAVALFSSCTSVLIFLAILTSRFALEDFLISLPNRLIKGIVFLFISMVTMMSAFGVTIYIIIRDRYGWCYFPIIVAGLVPVFTFFWMISTLLIDLWQATWNSIFNKTARHLYY